MKNMTKFIQKKGKKKAGNGKSKKMGDLTPAKQIRIISQKLHDQKFRDMAISKLDNKLLKEMSFTLKKAVKYMLSVEDSETEAFEVARQQIKDTSLSLFKHLDESGCTRLFCQVAPLFKDFSFEKGSDLLLDDIRSLRELKFPPDFWKAYCVYTDKHKHKFFLKMKKRKGFKFMDLAPIVKKKMEIKNNPIRQYSQFEALAESISVGASGFLMVVNALGLAGSLGVSAPLSWASLITASIALGAAHHNQIYPNGGGGGSGGGSGG